MRCKKLGIDFANEGEIAVDRCCDYRRSLTEALPKVAVVQDFYHLKERIMLTLSANSPHPMRSLAISLMPSHRRGRMEMEDRLSIDPLPGKNRR